MLNSKEILPAELKATDILAVYVSYNGDESIIKSAMALKGKVGYIHIVDNNSSEKTKAILRELQASLECTIEWLPENKGIGYALNLGIALAKSLGYKYILTMDQDSIPDENMVIEMVGYANRNSKDKIVAYTPSIHSYGNAMDNGASGPVEVAITSGNLICLQVFPIVGLFNEEFFIDSVDFEFCLRLKMHGLTIHRVDSARMIHCLGEVQSNRSFSLFNFAIHSPLRRYYIVRNHFYLANKYFRLNKVFIFKKSVFMFLLVINILVFESKKTQNLKMMLLGFKHYLNGVTGKFVA